ncbi:hypothetical protein MFIFM68171_02212 [Madurella fahalii]|uniref:Uncharacterized protein n=1 Tax=Madurella fahalii TaxID=1157608 RepID=A0ABQ0G2P6_9PEZI
MSNKITDARIQELDRKIKRRDELKEKIQKEKDALNAIRNAISKGDTEELISSSSKAARDARNKGGSSTLTNQDVIDTYTIAIERLEEEYEKVEEELKGLKELMEPRSP